ncbi:hypothetical protein EGH22_05200 [Halomicroarcula sp. F28]|uniref:hypothetical protein n=1 Tax=Haloarcula salinisoli TaxID=2487746 RepID=UPI001C73DF0E|nr:hypothetical protein [Halomicroarcula salinisoli]MBX0285711.1 hypothetical protein [Halomicroarcula salinisoli]
MGTAVLGSFAGCAQFDQSASGGDGSNGEATETEAEADEPTGPYRAWLPEPDAFGEDHYYFWYIDYAQLRANESHFDPEVYDVYTEDEALFARSDFSAADVDGAVSLTPVNDGNTYAVVTGSFSATAVADSLTEREFEEDRDIDEYTVYRNPGRGEFGVKDGTIVLTGNPDSDHVRTLIETKNGEVSRYTEASEAMATLLQPVGPETFVGGDTSDPYTDEQAEPESFQFAGQVGYSFGETVDGDRTTREIVVLFETADDVDMDAIAQFTGSDWFATSTDVSSKQEGRMVTITAELPTDEFYAN